jgi:hypothetical protein
MLYIILLWICHSDVARYHARLFFHEEHGKDLVPIIELINCDLLGQTLTTALGIIS